MSLSFQLTNVLPLFNSVVSANCPWILILTLLLSLPLYALILNLVVIYTCLRKSNSTGFQKVIKLPEQTWLKSGTVWVIQPTYLITIVVFSYLALNGPEASFWFSHFFFNGYTVKFFFLITLYTITVLWVLRSLFHINDLNRILILLVFFGTPSIFHNLYASTNFISLIISFEIITASVFLLLVVVQLHDADTFSKNINPAILFFWISTISSISFFVFLVLFGTASLTTCTLVDNFYVYSTIKPNSTTDLFIKSIFVFVFFFKLGLPPFLSWKFSFFQSLNVKFVYYYNLIYLTFFFSYFMRLLFDSTNIFTDFFLNPSLQITWFLIIVSLSVLFIRILNLGFFFVVSTATTSSFLIWVHIYRVNELSVSESEIPNLADLSVSPLSTSTLLYFYVYVITIATFLLALTQANVRSLNLSFPAITALIKHSVNDHKLSYLFIVSLLSFAGLPPFTLFFLKIHILSSFQNVGFFAPFLLLMSFLFLTLLFYFRNIRFFLTQYLSGRSHTKSKFGLLIKSYSHSKYTTQLKLDFCHNNYIIFYNTFILSKNASLRDINTNAFLILSVLLVSFSVVLLGDISLIIWLSFC